MDQAIFWKNENISLYYLEYYFQIYYLICLKVQGLLYLSLKSTWICMYLCMFLGSENQWHCKTDVYWRKENKLLGGLLLESTIPAPAALNLLSWIFHWVLQIWREFNCNVVLWKNVQTFVLYIYIYIYIYNVCRKRRSFKFR